MDETGGRSRDGRGNGRDGAGRAGSLPFERAPTATEEGTGPARARRCGLATCETEARRWWMSRRLAAWHRFAVNGGWGAPGLDDDDEALFGTVDLTPKERVEARMGLRGFLLAGQGEWSRDGGVKLPDTRSEPAAKRILEYVRRAERRRPTTVIPFDGDARDHLGVTWDPKDFEGMDKEIEEILAKTRTLEREQLEHLARTGYHCGYTINKRGCEELGLPQEKIREWTEGVDFKVDPNLPHYSKGAYQIVYRTRDFIVMTGKEFNKLLRWLIPVAAVPWVESRVMIVVKPSVLEESGFKNRPVIDETASGLNGGVEHVFFGLPGVVDVIKAMSPWSLMGKRDLSDMFYSFLVNPRRWTLLGVRHPITGQSYVMPVLPMGFTLSPPIACANTQLLTDIMNVEMENRWAGKAGHPAFAHIPRSKSRPARRVAAPHTTTYVDDFMDRAWEEWLEELIQVGETVFRLAGMSEKLSKRERGYALIMLGFAFDSRTGVLRVPEGKCQEILALLRSVLERAKRRQSVSLRELSSLGGKLMWACAAVVCGRFYLRNVRKLVVAVQDILATRLDREAFCVQVWHFGKALEELEWWEQVLTVGGGVRAWYVGEDGKFKAWRWDGAFGDSIPADVVQFATDASTSWGGGLLLRDGTEGTGMGSGRKTRDH